MHITNTATPSTEQLMHPQKSTLTRGASAQPKCGLANVLAVWLWLGWIANYWLSLVLGCLFAHLRWHATLSCLVGAYAVMVALPCQAGVSTALGSAAGKWIVERAAEYFSLRVLFEDADAIRDAATPLIFALEPHDVLPVSMVAFNSHLNWIPGHRCAGLMTSAVFSLPGMKTVFSLLSARSVDRKTFSGLLQQGTSVCFCPGGVQEVIHLENEREVVLFLNARLGFARLALEHRTPAVPCFTFGLAGTYSHRFMRGRVAERIARSIGFLPGAYWGIGGIFFGPPRPRPLKVVVGKPVPLPEGLQEGDAPSADAIRTYHAQFVEAMRELFEAHKAEMGMRHVALRII